jgi:hypothetical protein
MVFKVLTATFWEINILGSKSPSPNLGLIGPENEGIALLQNIATIYHSTRLNIPEDFNLDY